MIAFLPELAIEINDEEIPDRPLNDVAVRTYDDEEAIVVSCDWSNEPPIPTAIIVTFIPFSAPAAADTSSVDFPAIRTTNR